VAADIDQEIDILTQKIETNRTTILKPHDCAVCHDFELCSDYGLAAPNQSECWITGLPIVNSKVGGSN
jgi:hypothetical protein